MVDLNNLSELMADYRADLNMREQGSSRSKLRTKLTPMKGDILAWLKSQKRDLELILDELESVAIDSYDAELYNTGVRLLEGLNEATAPYNANYLAFEKVVNLTTYKNISEEKPSEILFKLAEHKYSLPQAIDALRHYLNLCEGRFGAYPNAEEIRDELLVIEMLEGMY